MSAYPNTMRLVDLARMALAEVGANQNEIAADRDMIRYFTPAGKKAGRLAAIHMGVAVRCDAHPLNSQPCEGVAGIAALAGLQCGAAS